VRITALYKNCRWVPIYLPWRHNVRDEGNNFLVELALAGDAEAIVTNNVHDLRTTELRFPVVPVLTPEHWLKGESHGGLDHQPPRRKTTPPQGAGPDASAATICLNNLMGGLSPLREGWRQQRSPVTAGATPKAGVRGVKRGQMV
jgi:hypothetical protein